ncbi:hypothetical protein [Shewanella surugensis]|uniref:Uncharacterized protein n=1 Tax=Shewanella surugensis TaxID=212020 RepID=A0ABT0LKI8_9GAMM|nr:hypothetical protein [Shewanella surugensis]MCL1127995.1 hypothetical protein [Shewanella surugensis]
MSSYSGTFSVMNNTGGTISNVNVQHHADDHESGTVQASTLANDNSTGGGQVFASSSHRDHWSVTYIASNGNLHTGNESCGFESEDNGDNVTIILNSDSWSVNIK